MNTETYLAMLWNSECIQHYGVKGMHWGERKAQARLNESIRNRKSGYDLATKYDNAMANKVVKRQINYNDAVHNKKGTISVSIAKGKLDRAKQEKNAGDKLSSKYRKSFDKDVARKQAKLEKIKRRNEKINNGSTMKYIDATVTNAQIKRERKQAYKNRAKMSDQELRDMTNRINAENNLKRAINGSDSEVVSSYKKAVVGAVVATAINYTVRKVITPQNLIKVLT